MSTRNIHVCPTEISLILNNKFRRWLQNARKILAPYIKEGMDVLEVGCGPGFFTLDMARVAGENGKVVAADLQEDMLAKVRENIRRSGSFDFVFLFYMVHEVPDKSGLFRELLVNF